MSFVHTTPWALYNEIDEYAADWLENLIARGLIAKGVVDRRSIEDVRPDDLRGFRQVHLFAGIGVWSYAARRAGISDDTAIWTCSCPCQPFSAAGKGDGVDDERHLWPHAHHLIRERRPQRVFGEQVASKDGLAWLELVQADMEASDYAIGFIDTCSAGFGAPHIRQRLRFAAHDLRSSAGGMADPHGGNTKQSSGQWSRSIEAERGRSSDRAAGRSYASRLADQHDDEQWQGGDAGSAIFEGVRSELGGCGDTLGLDNNNNKGLERFGQRYQTEIRRLGEVRSASSTGEFGGMGDTSFDRDREHTRILSGDESQYEIRPEDSHYSPFATSGADGMADHESFGRREQRQDVAGSGERGSQEELGQRSGRGSLFGHNRPTGPTNGFWSDADWLFCRDGKWRPVEPESFPLVDGIAVRVGSGSPLEGKSRVGMLKAYGNAVDAEATREFIQAYLEKDVIDIESDATPAVAPSSLINSTNSGMFKDLLG